MMEYSGQSGSAILLLPDELLLPCEDEPVVGGSCLGGSTSYLPYMARICSAYPADGDTLGYEVL